MKMMLIAAVLALASGTAAADGPRAQVLAAPDARVALGRDDRVTVSYLQVRRYRCAEGVLVVREWGSRFRLTCSTDGFVDAPRR